jgi:hypothetical protein
MGSPAPPVFFVEVLERKGVPKNQNEGLPLEQKWQGFWV